MQQCKAWQRGLSNFGLELIRTQPRWPDGDTGAGFYCYTAATGTRRGKSLRHPDSSPVQPAPPSPAPPPPFSPPPLSLPYLTPSDYGHCLHLYLLFFPLTTLHVMSSPSSSSDESLLLPSLPTAVGLSDVSDLLLIKIMSPAPGFPRDVSFRLPPNSTIKQVKECITSSLVSRPPTDQQRLIYRGKMMQDENVLESVLGLPAGACGTVSLLLLSFK